MRSLFLSSLLLTAGQALAEGPAAPPSVRVFPQGKEAFAAVQEVLRANLHGTATTEHPYPSPQFRGSFLWDTAFISLVWSRVDIKVSQRIIENALSFQRPDGMIPQVVLDALALPIPLAKHTQPPLLGWAAWRLQLVHPDRAFIARIYPKLVRFHEWYRANRRHPGGLYFWAAPTESGMDNSPRFDQVTDMRQVLSPDAASYVSMALEALLGMAKVLGKPEEAAVWDAERQELWWVVNNALWDEHDGLYYDYDLNKGGLIRTNTISSLLPLAAGIPSRKRSERLLSHILDVREYGTPMPLPSVARNDPSFEKNMWRGPVWVNASYFIIRGMHHYGYRKKALEYAKRLVGGVYATWSKEGSFYEFYDPERNDLTELHRRPGGWGVLLGDRPASGYVGWTGLVNNLAWEYGEGWLIPQP